MLYTILAQAVLLIHLAFIIYVVFGGLLVFVRRWTAWLHLPTVAWGFFIEVSGRICPLTPLENRLRLMGSQQGYAGGFIEHYLLAAIYPEGLTRTIQLFLGFGVLAINGLLYGILLTRAQYRG